MFFYIVKLTTRTNALSILTIYTFWFCAGCSILTWNKEHLKSDYFARKKDVNGYILRINDVLIEKEKGFKTTAEVISVITDGKMTPACGTVSVFISRNKGKLLPIYGDELLTKQRPIEFQSPVNPEEFDYKKYMALNNIRYQLFLKEGDYFITNNSGYSVFKYIYALRHQLSSYLENLNTEVDNRGVAKALLLGETNELSPHLISAYAGTGTLHVLSVSGLHVGIIFIVLGWLTMGMKRNKYLRIIRVLFLLGFLFGYAIITGLSSSILRSVVMFTFMLIGDQLRQGKSIINTIYLSAFLLLCWNPFYIAQVGFQLSYIALLGIVWLQKPISNLIHLPVHGWLWWLPQKAWELTSVSLAAQIATFPLGLLYFNQFPLYFLLSNLLIIPLSSLILGLGCLFLLVKTILSLITISFLKSFTLLLGFVFIKLIELLNNLISIMNGLPSARIEGTYLREWECATIYMIIIILGFSLIYKQKYLLRVSFLLIIIFFSSRAFLRVNSFSQNRFTRYQIPKHKNVFSIKTGEKLYLVGDSGFIHNSDLIKYYIFRYANKNFVSPENVIPIKYSKRITISNSNFEFKNGVFRDRNTTIKVY